MQKIFYLILIFLLQGDTVSAQVNNPNFTPFAWGAFVGGTISNANPKQPNYSNINKSLVPNITFGGTASFRKNKYYFETGLNYFSEGYAFTSTVKSNISVKNQKNEFKFYSMMVPFRIVVPVQGVVCKHLPSLALNVEYVIKCTQLQTTEYENSPLTKNVYNVTSDYKKIKPSLTLAYGVEFDLDLNNALRIEPFLQMSMINAKEELNKTLIRNYGIRAYFLFLR